MHCKAPNKKTMQLVAPSSEAGTYFSITNWPPLVTLMMGVC